MQARRPEDQARPAGPYRRDTLAARGAGFAAVMALAYVLLPFTDAEIDWTLVAVAIALNVALLAAAVLLPWEKIDRRAVVLPPLAYVAVVYLLRDAGAGAVSGYGILVLLPVVWTALYIGPRELAVVLAGVALAFALPIVLVGPPEYPASEWRRAALTTAVGTLIGVVTDQLVRHIRARAEEFRTIMQSAGEGILRLDADGRVELANPAAEAILRRSAAELAGAGLHAVAHGKRPDGSPYPAEECPILAAVAGTPSGTVSSDVFWRPDGTAVPVEYRAEPLDGGDGGAVVTFSDITERREVERLKDEFVSTVGHELRTPLTAIRGSLGLIESGMVGPVSEEAQGMLEIGISNTDRLVRLINDILDIERIESGRVPMVRRLCDLADILDGATDLMGGPAREAGLVLDVQRERARLWADPDRVLQVLTNLLSNAIKFTPPGGRVTVSAEAGEEEVVVTVRDEGRGIPQDLLDTVFERFAQVDASDAREKGGTGLGLAIARSIVHQHDGRIWVRSAPGEGAAFSFALPLVRAIPGALPAALVFSADADFRAGTSAILRNAGYAVAEEPDLGRLVTRVADERPAVLIVDAQTCEDREALLSRLREDPRTREVPVVTLAEDVGRGTRRLDEPTLVRALRGVVGEARRALIVEDDPSLAAVLGTMLQRHGVETIHAVTAADAIRALADHPPDLVILDLVLPGGYGGEVVDWLRGRADRRSVPIVVYTALDIDEQARARLDVGATEFLTKSRVSPEELEQRLVRIIDGVAAPTERDA